MTPNVPQIALIGTGVMGEAVLGSLTAAVGPDRVRIADGRPEHGRAVAEKHRVAYAGTNADAVADADVVVVAVKPKDLDELCAQIGPVLREGALVVSVVAGAATDRIAAALGRETAVVRVMPNTPAVIGRGIAVTSAGAHATEADLDLVAELLAGTGRIERAPEADQDVVTAVSGSGPAYVFYLIEAMRDAGVAGGLDPEVALTLARETVAGAAAMAVADDTDPAELRRRVTSPGGTTQAAIEELDAREVKAAVVAAARRAWEKAAELGGR